MFQFLPWVIRIHFTGVITSGGISGRSNTLGKVAFMVTLLT
jgi:hypothetical protein